MPAPQPDPAHLRLGTFSPSVLLRVARRAGLLDRHGISVTESAVPSSPAQFRALLGGELDAALTSPDNVVAYRFVPGNPLGRTMDVRIVAGIDRGLGLALYGRPGLTATDALRGAVVAVDVATSGFAFALYEILERAGLRAGGDYRLVELGSTPRRLQALVAGDCDATLLNAGNDLHADEQGFPQLARVVDVLRPYLGTVLAVAGPPAAPARALAGALRDAAAALRAGTLGDIAVEEAEAIGLPPALAKRYAERLLDRDEGLVPDGSGQVDGLETVVRLRRRHAPALVDGADVLAGALAPSSGLVDALW